MSRSFAGTSEVLRGLPWLVRAALVPPSLYLLFIAGMQTLNPAYLFGANAPSGIAAVAVGMAIFVAGAVTSAHHLAASSNLLLTTQ